MKNKNYPKTDKNIECPYCNNYAPMDIIMSGNDLEEVVDNDFLYEQGDVYHILKCIKCKKNIITKSDFGPWLETEDGSYDFSFDIIYPEGLQNKNSEKLGINTQDLIDQIKDIMINVATGKKNIDEVNKDYKTAYNQLDSMFLLSQKNNPNQFSDLWEFYNYWKKELPDYASRRDFVINLYKKKEENTATSTLDFWSLIHPSIRSVSESRFKSAHYADSVEAAFKEINIFVKKLAKGKLDKLEDGRSLMFKVFKLPNPIIFLDNIETENGRNIQEGYMYLFGGSMQGIRNPKAHANLVITKEQAIRFLCLASLLMYKLNERKT